MRNRSKPLDRRTLLRGVMAGATVAIGLPRLEAMFGMRGAAYADPATPPLRFGVWFWGNGILAPRWVPTTTGANWELTEQLAPLVNVKPSLSVVTGMNVRTPGHTHGSGLCGILTGAGCGSADADIINVLPSIDQIVARSIGGATRIGSLQVGSINQKPDPQFGPALYYTSYPAANSYNANAYNSGKLFERLFGTNVASNANQPDPRQALRASVLDVVKNDIVDLRGAVGAQDNIRLDQHLDGIRDLEKQVAAASQPLTCEPPQRQDLNAPFDVADDAVDDVMLGLTAYALACDVTRVFTYQYMYPGHPMNFPGLPDEFHNLCHTEGNGQPTVNQYVIRSITRLAKFLEKLQSLPELGGTLLDNCAILATSELSDGNTHSNDEFPILLAGKAGGKLRAGIHHRANGDNASKVILTLGRIMGVPLTAFGKDEGYVTDEVSELRT